MHDDVMSLYHLESSVISKCASQSAQDQPPKAKYRITNWSDYNKALVGRGSLTLWFHEDLVAQWNTPTQTDKPGHPFVYADLSIECALTLKAVYGLALRQTQGFLALFDVLFIYDCRTQVLIQHLVTPIDLR
jgi:hypothetical protein